MDVDTPGKQRHVDMRRHRHASCVVHHARLDRIECPLTRIEGGGGAAKAVESFFRVEMFVIDPFMVGLPQFQKRVAHQVAITVVDIAKQQDVLTRSIGPGHFAPNFLWTRRIAGRSQRQADMHIGASSLRWGFR